VIWLDKVNDAAVRGKFMPLMGGLFNAAMALWRLNYQ